MILDLKLKRDELGGKIMHDGAPIIGRKIMHNDAPVIRGYINS